MNANQITRALTGYDKLYAAKKSSRIVYRFIDQQILVEAVAMGKREDLAVYRETLSGLGSRADQRTVPPRLHAVITGATHCPTTSRIATASRLDHAHCQVTYVTTVVGRALTGSTQAPIMRRIEADRKGAELPVADYHQSTMTDFIERSLHVLGHPHDSIKLCDVHVSETPVFRRNLRSRIV